MNGMGRSRMLAVRSTDPVLSLLAALGLGAAAGTALVIDLVGVPTIGDRTLADMAVDGPKLEELRPGRSGVAVVGSGSLEGSQAAEMIEGIAASWPATVVRIDSSDWPGRVVPVVPLLPGWLAPQSTDAAVWQPVGASVKAPGPGPVMPRLRQRVVRDLLSGRQPRRSRWIDAWSQVWELPWA